MQKNTQIKGVLLMLTCALMWSTGGILIKLVPWNPLVLGGWRSLFCGLTYLTYMLFTKRRIRFDMRSLCVGVASSIASFCFLAANKLTTAANAIVLQYTSPVFFVLFSMIFQKKKFRRKDYAVVGVTMAGIVLFFMDSITPGNMLGNFIAIMSGMVFAVMYMLLGEAKDEGARVSGMLIGTLISTLVGLPLSAVYPPQQITLPIVLAVMGMGIFQLGIPNIMYSAAINSTSMLVCSILASTELLLNPVWVYLLTGEVPGLWAFIGASVIAATITLWVASDARNANAPIDRAPEGESEPV